MGTLKNNLQNKLAKESITIALMILMEKKDFNEISITDITKKAGVSRMAYYRNYDSKEDIINKYLDDLFQGYSKDILKYNEPDMFRDLCLYFAYFRKHEKLIVNLIHSNLTNLILDRFDNYLYVCFKSFISNNTYQQEIEKYIIKYTSGGLFKVLIEWVKSDLKESDEKMAEIVCSILGNNTVRDGKTVPL